MRKIVGLIAAVFLLAGCTSDAAPPSSGSLRVVTTFSLLGDIASELGGEDVHVHSMVPLGTDPHDYHPLPVDIEAATQADVIIWNGLDMETGEGWFANLVEVAGKDLTGPEVVEAADGVAPQWLDAGAVNPHAFLSPRAGVVYTENIAAALADADPGNSAAYASRAADLLREIRLLDERYAAELGALENPVLVTSERAFQYVAADYGLTEGYLWQIDTDEQGTPAQITTLITFIREHEPQGLLVETNVDPRPLETVAAETGVPIVGEVYSDELGPPDSPGATYLGYLETNLESYLRAMR